MENKWRIDGSICDDDNNKVSSRHLGTVELQKFFFRLAKLCVMESLQREDLCIYFPGHNTKTHLKMCLTCTYKHDKDTGIAIVQIMPNLAVLIHKEEMSHA
jgi:hypothetical protein